MRAGVSRWVRIALGIAATGCFLVLALLHVDISSAISVAAKVHPMTLVLALIAVCLGYTTRVARWWWMLRSFDSELPLRACAWPLIVSVSINNLVPLRAGDIVRGVWFRRELRATPSRVFGSLLVERLLDMTVLVMMLAIFAGSAGPVHWRSGLAVVCVSAIAWTFVLTISSPLGERLRRFIQARSSGHIRDLDRHLVQFLLAVGLVRSPIRLIQLATFSVLVWVCEGGVFAAIAYGLGYVGPLGGPWFACALGTLSTLIPSSPGYVGTFDYFVLTALVGYGASRAVSAAFALLVHGILWLTLTGAGLIYFLTQISKSQRAELTASLIRGQERT